MEEAARLDKRVIVHGVGNDAPPLSHLAISIFNWLQAGGRLQAAGTARSSRGCEGESDGSEGAPSVDGGAC